MEWPMALESFVNICGGKANYPWVMGLLDGHAVSSKVQILQMQKTPLRIELIIMIKIQFFAGEVWTPRHCIHQKKKKTHYYFIPGPALFDVPSWIEQW